MVTAYPDLFLDSIVLELALMKEKTKGRVTMLKVYLNPQGRIFESAQCWPFFAPSDINRSGNNSMLTMLSLTCSIVELIPHVTLHYPSFLSSSKCSVLIRLVFKLVSKEYSMAKVTCCFQGMQDKCMQFQKLSRCHGNILTDAAKIRDFF